VVVKLLKTGDLQKMIRTKQKVKVITKISMKLSGLENICDGGEMYYL
jgi:hypothetical protein